MSPGSNTESYPAFAHIGLRENPGKTSTRNIQPLPTTGLSAVCQNHILNAGKEAVRGSEWALQMLDATSKVSSGLLQGNIFEFGNFDECLEVDVHEEWGSFLDFRGGDRNGSPEFSADYKRCLSLKTRVMQGVTVTWLAVFQIRPMLVF
ncbi:hypothetical protein ANN_05079 [Periplaneta americana]|uniref:Nose resistant-to-fluoxetine protein N-terminal domain-containing protein n=1 Tax=Periplaneta americana TaxID=6978 RepID=A0ABQ8TA37_PERAM|nr:hypothetical protein ANN_05079 [Periplaneta americana]